MGGVVLLTGPSGAGKSRLARRLHTAYGWPVVRLDDFYREGEDPVLPMVELGGTRLPDWDDPRSWRADAAVAALTELMETGRTEVPSYDLATSSTIGRQVATAPLGGVIVAEGIFAAEIAPALRERGLLIGAYCITHGRLGNYLFRLGRDLRERRKPPLVLIRRGWELGKREAAIVSRAVRLGAVCATPNETFDAIARHPDSRAIAG